MLFELHMINRNMKTEFTKDYQFVFENVKNDFKAHIELVNSLNDKFVDEVVDAALDMVSCLKKGGKILIVGNGGSAADAQHIAAELTGRFIVERRALAAIALTTDTSALTAIGNDYGFDSIFERQVEALAKEGDLLLAISTSGKSKNIVNAIEKAKNKGCRVIGLTGRDGGFMKNICDKNIIVPSTETARIQEIHIMIGHIFCSSIDFCFCASS